MTQQESGRVCRPATAAGPQPRAFTLLELLTVLAVIGVLLSLLLPTSEAARNAALRTQTKVRFAQWAAACELFRQEYGHYPEITRDGRIDPERFAAALLGRRQLLGERLSPEAGRSQLNGNLRRLSFLQLTPEEVTDDGSALRDAFGNTEIGLRVDWNADGLIDAADMPAGGAGGWVELRGAAGQPLRVELADPVLAERPLAARLAFYSVGRGRTAADFVLSWR